MTKHLIVLMILWLPTIGLSQPDPSPVAVHPSLGDTIELEERVVYGLLPGYPGYQWAALFRGGDSTGVLTVSFRDGASADTIALGKERLARFVSHRRSRGSGAAGLGESPGEGARGNPDIPRQ